MSFQLPSGNLMPPRMHTTQPFDNQNVTLGGGTADGPSARSDWAQTAVVVIPAAGADITVTLQGSVDDGATWYDIADVAAPRQAVAITEPLVRLRATNAGAADQAVTAHLTLGR